jgi:toxin CptA
MHAAPSVRYPVGRSAFSVLLYAAAAVAALAVAALWTAEADRPGWRQGLAFGVAAACMAVALLSWLRSPAGALRWDGDAWTWEGPREPEAGRPAIALDLQARLLLQWRNEAGRVRWFWLARTSAPADWDALRRAVYSRASAPVPRAGEPPAAEQ